MILERQRRWRPWLRPWWLLGPLLGPLLGGALWANSELVADLAESFDERALPFLKQHCVRCHNAEKMKSGIRLDQLDGQLNERHLRLWETIQNLVSEGEMPPEDEEQPTALERAAMSAWISDALDEVRSRDVARNGSVRRLTVAQYRNALHDLLGLEDDFSAWLPPEAISRDGFENNKDSMLLSPLLLEAYFDIAEKALDRCLLDLAVKPTIQNFRMDLGLNINPRPLPETLILGAASRLLPNSDFTVTELTPRKSFAYEPFFMQRQFRFIEGYQGNSTVRGWREYDSIYHAVFACLRGSGGYPLGNPYDLVPEGLLLRPAIPSAELFQVESTYGPKANFKVALRQLPDHGRFRVTVRAARYEDALLLDNTAKPFGEGIEVASLNADVSTVDIDTAGVYQVEVYREPPSGGSVAPDGKRLNEGLLGMWDFDDGPAKSPFGQALSLSGNDEQVIDRGESIHVGEGDFTVAAWIRPSKLQQGGIVAMGPYGRKGWVFDMPNASGVLRLEAFKGYQDKAGTIQTKPGVIRKDRWQHVAAVARRGSNGVSLFVNGYEMASGSLAAVDLDNPKVGLNIGRVPEANYFSGEIDAVRLFSRALEISEIQALVEPGRSLALAPRDGRQPFSLQLEDRFVNGTLEHAPFAMIRLPAGPLTLSFDYSGTWNISRIVFAPVLDIVPFEQFEQRVPILGVHFGLRRDCGHTLNPVGEPKLVEGTSLKEYVFEGAINNFPSPDVEKDNVNYISGLREIGVRSEYTDGQARPRLLVRSIEFEGPLYETWPPKTHRNLISGVDPLSMIRSFAERAYRRPISEEEEVSLMKVFDQSYAVTSDPVQSLRDVFLVVLTSPQFLFLIEESQGPEPESIDGYELASKLSFFLWNTSPDQELLDLAEVGGLSTGLDTQVDRLVEDSRFERFSAAFVSQWLGLDKIDMVETDRKRFPALTRDVKKRLRLEPVRFVEHLIRENLPLKNLVRSEFVVTDEVLADYYGLGNWGGSGFEFLPVVHQKPHLGGLLSQAGILAALSDGREANPIKRGAWFARKIIAEPPADPPPNVPDLSESTEHLTLRERLEKHRNQEGCVKCHEGIDPWGLPFEQFDAGGRFTGLEGLDASSTLPDSTQVSGLRGLQTYLIDERLDQVAFSFLKHLTTYAVGRDLSYNEVEFLRSEALGFKNTEYRLRDLLRFVIQSDVFQKK